MANISRRAFLKRVVVGAGTLTLYANGGFQFTNALAAAPVYKLRILHTNDHHSHIEPVSDSYKHGGVSRRQTYIASVRAAQQAAKGGSDPYDLLLVDAGDYFQGSLYYSQYKGYADLDFYRRMGYQVGTIGNHEFDDSNANLAKFIKGATTGTYPDAPADVPALGGSNFPIISANIDVPAGDPLEGLIQPNTVIALSDTGSEQKIGFFGLTTPETTEISSPGAGTTFADPVARATAQVAALKPTVGAKIIALTHLGYGVDVELAKQTSGIALIIGGHSHTPVGSQPNAQGDYPTVVTNAAGKPVLVLTDWEYGRWCGDIVVGFDADGQVSTVTSSPTEMQADTTKDNYIEPDANFETLIGTDTTGYKKQIAEVSARAVGKSEIALDGVTANVRSRETNLANLLTDAVLAKVAEDAAKVAYPKVVITNGGGIRASIAAGDINYGSVLSVLPFGNTIARTDITGAQVLAALENGLGYVGGASNTGRFPQVAGLRYSFTTSRPAGSRVLSVEIKTDAGYVALDAAATYRVYTNNYMLTGGDGYTAFTEGSNKLDIGFVLADALAEHIAALSADGGAVDDADITGGRITRSYMTWLPVVENVK